MLAKMKKQKLWDDVATEIEMTTVKKDSQKQYQLLGEATRKKHPALKDSGSDYQ